MYSKRERYWKKEEKSSEWVKEMRRHKRERREIRVNKQPGTVVF